MKDRVICLSINRIGLSILKNYLCMYSKELEGDSNCRGSFFNYVDKLSSLVGRLVVLELSTVCRFDFTVLS